MRLVLMDNLLVEDGRIENLYLQPHLGLISLVAVARGAGHSAVLYDPKVDFARGALELCPSLYRAIADRLLAEDPDVIGFTSLGCNFICTLKVAQHVKTKRPSLPILLGGPHATILDQEILAQFPQFNVIARNEAELTLLPLLEQLSGGNLGLIPGITYRTASGVTANPGEPLIPDLDSLPWPAFDSYPLASLGLSSVSIEAGRGCPFKCSFCSTATFFGRRYRLKSPQRIGAEMDYLNANYGFTRFALTHDLFTVDKRKVLAFCQYMKDKPYEWDCSARMDCVDDELLEQMQASGCRSIYYGVETGSPRMQKIVDKHLNLGLVEPRLATTRRLGMTATASFITGFPEEEAADQNETLDMMGACLTRDPKTVNVQLHLLTPEPGTGLTQRFGGSLEYDGHVTDFTFPTLESDDTWVMRSHPNVFMNHHYYPTVLARQRHVFVTSIYLTLRSFGYVVLGHLIEFYGGRLSNLIEDMYRWVVETGRRAPYDEALVSAYLEDRWPRHYLVSVIQFLRSCRAVESRTREVGDPRDRPSRRRPLVVAPTAALLRDIHNVPRILEDLEASEGGESNRMSASLRRRRLDVLLYVADDSTEIRSFALKSAARSIVEFLSVPRSAIEVRRFVLSLGNDADRAKDFIRQLLDLGILVEAKTEDAKIKDAAARTAIYPPVALVGVAGANPC